MTLSSSHQNKGQFCVGLKSADCLPKTVCLLARICSVTNHSAEIVYLAELLLSMFDSYGTLIFLTILALNVRSVYVTQGVVGTPSSEEMRPTALWWPQTWGGNLLSLRPTTDSKSKVDLQHGENLYKGTYRKWEIKILGLGTGNDNGKIPYKQVLFSFEES